MYSYEEQKPRLFTDEGQRLFIKVRESVLAKVQAAGSVTLSSAIQLPPGVACADNFMLIACVDRMVDIGDLRRLKLDGSESERVFVEA